MIVCHCHQISDRDIRDAVRGGCDTVSAVGVISGAGSDCGGCAPHIQSLVDDELTRGASTFILASSLRRRVA